MFDYLASANAQTNVISIIPIAENEYGNWLVNQTDKTKNWLDTNNFKAKSSAFCLIPDPNGKLEQIILIVRDRDDFWALGVLPKRLPAGMYTFKADMWSKEQLQRAVIAWGLACYKFVKKSRPDERKLLVQLIVPENCDRAYIENVLSATYLVRDLINTPAEEMGPEELANAVLKVASKFGAQVEQIVGDDLLQRNFPSIHAVGRASARLPRLLDLRWGDAKGPKVTLVGKGICFDSGGLDLKSRDNMLKMKKDMAGVAHVLGLAQMIMQAKLPINLRVIMPIAENMVSGKSYKPGDILTTRKGLTVEITNTDAEGRVLLADALALASEDKPGLLIDFATLTGGMLGPEISVLFTEDDKLVQDISMNTGKEQETVWRLPLYKPYKEAVEGKIADLSNCNYMDPYYVGTIVAALFLQEFVDPTIPWVHLDIFGFNAKAKPGRPDGGEAVCLKGLFNYIKSRY